MKSTFLVVAVLVFYSETACGFNPTLLFDLKGEKGMKSHPAISSAAGGSHKVKRAQEVVMFGNQQNKLSETGNYAPAEKRDIVNVALPDVQNEIDRDNIDDQIGYETMQQLPMYQPPSFRYRDTYYYDPDLYEVPYYEEERVKRDASDKSTIPKEGTVPSDGNKRLKRNMEVDPQQLLALLTLWEQEKHHKDSPDNKQSVFSGNRFEDYDLPTNDEANEVANEDFGANDGTWYERPVIPSHRYTKVVPRFYPPYNNWIMNSNNQAKRYTKQNIDYLRAISNLDAGNGHQKEKYGSAYY